jgi:Predicted transcriptional regulators
MQDKHLVTDWRLWRRVNQQLYILYRFYVEQTIYAPFYICSFPFERPLKFTDSQNFFEQYSNPKELKSTADKLRYFRYKKSFLQRDIADSVGIDRSTYIDYESAGRDYYPVEKLQKIAELLEVDVIELLDDYNRFLFDGQGRQIRTLRKKLGLTQYQFGKLNGVNVTTIKRWEGDKVIIFKSTWKKLFAQEAEI